MTDPKQELDINDLSAATKDISDPDTASGLAIFAAFQLDRLIEELAEYFEGDQQSNHFILPMRDKMKAIQWYVDKMQAETLAKAGVWE